MSISHGLVLREILLKHLYYSEKQFLSECSTNLNSLPFTKITYVDKVDLNSENHESYMPK